MAICYHCGKKAVRGRSHTHKRGVAGGRWKKKAPKTPRLFRANIQRITIIEEGKQKRVKLCVKCLKRIKKDLTDKKKPFLQLFTYQQKPQRKQESLGKKENK
jgi:ribosomal protein L28